VGTIKNGADSQWWAKLHAATSVLRYATRYFILVTTSSNQYVIVDKWVTHYCSRLHIKLGSGFQETHQIPR
jgi:hypothetical protein